MPSSPRPPTPRLKLRLRPTRSAHAGDQRTRCLGIPLGIKDLFCTEGVQDHPPPPAFLQGFRPTYESTVTSNLVARGRGVPGQDRTWMSSPWAHRMNHAYYGPVVQPVAVQRKPRQSRSGAGRSQVVDRARRCRASFALGRTGTDTGGSIRQPAAFSGIVGLEADLWPLLSLGRGRVRVQPGPGRSDGALGPRLRHHARLDGGHDPMDSTSVDTAVPDYDAPTERRRQGPDDRHPSRVPRRRHARRNRRALGSGIAWLNAGRRRDRRYVSLPHTQ